MSVKDVRHTRVYQLAFQLAMEIFIVSKSFPKEEKYSLIDQIRRSSRSVCINLLEAYRKKKYPAYFVSKVTDSDMENSETAGWLDFSLSCNYISAETHLKFTKSNLAIGRLLNHMINNPGKY